MYIQKEIHQFRPALNSGFGVNVFHMGFYGVFAHMLFTGNHPVGFAFDEKGCDFTLAFGEFFCDTERTDQPGLFLNWHFGNRGQINMVFEQGSQSCMQGRKYDKGNAHHTQRQLGRIMALSTCDSVSNKPAQQNPQDIGREANAHNFCGGFVQLQHFTQDAPPKQVIHAAGSQH